MFDYLKIRVLKTIIVEIFCEKIKVCSLVISFVKNSSKAIQVVFYALHMQNRLTFRALSQPRSLSLEYG